MNKNQRIFSKVVKDRKRRVRKVVSGMNNHEMANRYFYMKKLEKRK